MEQHGSNALNIVVSIIIGLSIITFVIGAVAIALKVGNKGLSKTTEISSNLDESSYTQYDGEIVTGDQVVGIIKTLANDTICVAVSNGNSTTNYIYNPDLQSKATAKIADAQMTSKLATYINPTSKFLGAVVRDTNTQAITQLTFTIQP